MSQHLSQKSNKICLVGDFCLSGETTNSELLSTRIDPWASLRSTFGDDAVIIANIECPFTDEPHGLPFKWANLKTSPELHWLLDGLSVAVLGNNHFADFGAQGVRDTQALLTSKGILSVGYGESITDALKPAFLDVGGHRLGMLSLCCPTTNSENLATHRTPGVAPLGMQTLKQAIENAKTICDALLVYLHWGCEWVHDPAPDQLRLARYAIDCGADAVVGAHSHTIQSYEQYQGRWIFYGLGNYLFKAGYAQRFKDNGEVKQVPLALERCNRESLVVSFQVVPDNGSGRLSLDRVQPMFFGDDLIPRPIAARNLSFDLDACNMRLRKYVGKNVYALQDKCEPVFHAKLRNGVMAYWYSSESINPTTNSVFLKKLSRMIQKSINFAIQSANTITGRIWLEAKIMAKWRNDRRYLPLTPAHYELYKIIHRLCWRELNDFPNLVNCRDFNDKIQWLKLFDQNSEIIRCSDKITVRDYVRERVGDQYLVKLYQVHEHFSQIDFDALPNAFVIKTNHDSGTVILVRDKSKLDYRAAEARIEEALKRPYGWGNGEWAYSYIQPKVFVEEFIEPESSTPPPDYKFYCINGFVRFVHYIYDRGFDTKEQVLDSEGNDLATDLYPSFKLGKGFKKPAVWNQMVSVSESLGKGFKCVRVDLFCSGACIYVGEMTFWPMAGHYKGEGQKKMGKYLDFDRTTFKPFILPDLENSRSRFSLYPGT